MEKRREPFELVIHIDEAGTRATASYRTRIFDDAGVVDDSIPPLIDSVTLDKLGDEFPWSEFVDAGAKSAMIQLDAANTARKAAEQSAEKSVQEANARTDAAEQSLASFVSTIEAQLAALKDTKK